MKGVERVIVGYTGGQEPDPTYHNLKDHTESILIEFNPKVVSYWEILGMWHSNDYPWKRDTRQYRSAIFFKSLTQQDQALAFLSQLVQEHKKKVYVDVELAKKFYRAETYHQNYHEKRTFQTQQQKKNKNQTQQQQQYQHQQKP